VRYRDVHYAKRLIGKAWSNLRYVGEALGAEYLRIVPNRDFGGAEDGSCERFELGVQPAGFVRVNLAPYHLVLPEIAGKLVVEAGCNEGVGAALFAEHAREVLAFDRSEPAIAVARARHARPNLRFEVHDAAREFPIAPGAAEFVFSNEMIEHVPDGRPFFAAAARALAPGGTIVVKTPNDAFHRLENRLNPHHVNPYDAGRLRAEMEREFTAVEISGYEQKIQLDAAPEDRPESTPPEAMAYRFGDPIVIDRVLVLSMRVTPVLFSLEARVPEFLFARARKK
jgi:SAM-dependent methyltransferase